MKFLVDAQLPKALANFLRERGFDAIHTLELPNENRTDDLDINSISLIENRVVLRTASSFQKIRTFMIATLQNKSRINCCI